MAPLERPAAVLSLSGQLAPLAWAFAAVAPGLRLAYIETVGARRRPGEAAAAQLRARGLLAAHLLAGTPADGEQEALTTAAAIDQALRGLGCDAVVCGPGGEITDPGSPLGRDTMGVLEGAHTALALDCRVVLAALSGA